MVKVRIEPRFFSQEKRGLILTLQHGTAICSHYSSVDTITVFHCNFIATRNRNGLSNWLSDKHRVKETQVLKKYMKK